MPVFRCETCKSVGFEQCGDHCTNCHEVGVKCAPCLDGGCDGASPCAKHGHKAYACAPQRIINGAIAIIGAKGPEPLYDWVPVCHGHSLGWYTDQDKDLPPLKPHKKEVKKADKQKGEPRT